MQASTQADGSLNLRLETTEADKLRRSIKTAISAMVTLYAREGMTDAKNFLVTLQDALQDWHRLEAGDANPSSEAQAE